MSNYLTIKQILDAIIIAIVAPTDQQTIDNNNRPYKPFHRGIGISFFGQLLSLW